jgi:polynucleotide 5'-kinase involved in rRNA processing
MEFLVVNTDGWVKGEEAVEFKAQLAQALTPDVIYCLEPEEHVPSLCATFGDAFAGFTQRRTASATAASERTREKRKSLRELGFAKYFANARVKVYPLNYITVLGRENRELIRQHQADNVLAALFDGRKRFLGIGVVREVDYERRTLKVLTAVVQKPLFVSFGKIRLDKDLHETSEAAETAGLAVKEAADVRGK